MTTHQDDVLAEISYAIDDLDAPDPIPTKPIPEWLEKLCTTVHGITIDFSIGERDAVRSALVHLGAIVVKTLMDW